MELNTLKPINKTKKQRVGRGDGSGRGTYSGRGMKGQTARAGGRRRPGFEGGQTPLIRRMPKLRGFKSPNKITYQVVNVGDLEKTFDAGTKITKELLAKEKLIFNSKKPVKLLGNGELKKALEITVELVSASALSKIEKAKGKVTLFPQKKVVKKAVKKESVEKKEEKESKE
ncbi:50S ribosomal protein L15 [Candidatus Peregrinibacteria bacterium]|jgi:large subunit ribosomal protein L15|nr:50S ribosomal protein L15 [Candidatus Peregrinibacteria bacterium]